MIGHRVVRTRSDSPWVLGTALLFVTMAAVVGIAVAAQDAEGVRAAGVIAIVTLVTLVIFRLAIRDDPHGAWLFRVLVASLILKFGAVVFRLWFVLVQYGGVADALQYHESGERLADAILRSGLPQMDKYYSTQLVQLLTGIYYAFVGPTLVGAFVFWAWLGLMGMLFFYKAFTVAFPGGNRRLYALLILLYPSMLLWTSSLGKDALVCFSLGLMTYGAAIVMRRPDFRGWLMAAGGLAGVLFIRPHVAAMAGVALATGYLLRPIRAGLMTPVVKGMATAIVAVLAFVVVQTSADFIQLEELSGEGVLSYIEARQETTARGRSIIQRGIPTNPLALADGIATVFFRPYPWEAGNLFAQISAAEGVLLVALVAWRRRSVIAAIVGARRDTFLLMSVTYVLLFAFFFSAISNFAIIARQRAQLLPFILMWLAYLPARSGPRA